MVDYARIFIGFLAGFYAFTYGRWLMKKGDRSAGFTVYFIAFLCLALPVYIIIFPP